VENWHVEKIIEFLILFIPGFVSIKVHDLLIPAERRDFSKSIFEVFGYSFLNFAVLSPLIIPIHLGSFYNMHRFLYWFFIFVILAVFPVFWPILFIRLPKWRFFAKYFRDPWPTPWDYIFSKRKALWVIVNLKDGRKIGGEFDRLSSASSYPDKQQIYLEKVWKLDEEGNFIEAIPRSEGIVILGEEISSVEFFN
jgi:hypothetical protein